MGNELKSLFRAAGISSVCIVDDAIGTNNVTLEHFTSLATLLKEHRGIEALDKIDELLDFDENEEVLDQYCREVWSGAEPDRQLEIVRKLVDSVPTGLDDSISTNLNISGPINKLKIQQNLSKTDLIELSPVQWRERKSTLVSSIPSGGKMLLLFDQMLDEAGGEFTTTKGIDLVKETLESVDRDSFVVGLLTYVVTDENLELEKREELLISHNIDSEDLFVLSKIRLEKVDNIVDGIKKMLLNKSCERIKKSAIQIEKAALEETIKVISSLDTYDFVQSVLQSSSKEGIWPAETLFRIVDVINKDEIRKESVKVNAVKSLNDFFNKASEIQKVRIPIAGSHKYKAKFSLRRQEIYHTGRLINQLHKPIENGDIFETQNSADIKAYALLGQSCDLVIREKGKRKAGFAYLFEVEKKTKSEVETDIQNWLSEYGRQKPQSLEYWLGKGVLEFIDEDPDVLGIINFSKSQIVNLDVLDLAAFDSNGEAKFDSTLPEPDFLHSGLKKRFDALKKLHTDSLANLTEFKTKIIGLGLEDQLELIKLRSPNLSINRTLCDTVIETNGFAFGITRVKALREPFAKSLLSKYSRFISREADSHDFTDFEK